jgi:hypothetical protein
MDVYGRIAEKLKAIAGQARQANIFTAQVEQVSGSTCTVKLGELSIAVIRDAGVRINLVNLPADALTLTVDIYYNPLLLSPAAKPVEDAVKNYISSLEFNGALSATRLVDVMQAVPGVELVDITGATVAGNVPLGVQKIAASGHWAFKNESDLQINYIVYSNEANI